MSSLHKIFINRLYIFKKKNVPGTKKMWPHMYLANQHMCSRGGIVVVIDSSDAATRVILFND